MINQMPYCAFPSYGVQGIYAACLAGLLGLGLLANTAQAATYTVTGNGGGGGICTSVGPDTYSCTTLRAAITHANGTAASDTIVFDSAVSTIILNGNELEIISATTAGSLTIDGIRSDGSNLTISGNNASRILRVHFGADATLRRLNIVDGVYESGSGIYNSGGTLTITHSNVTGNSASEAAGGLLSQFGGTVHIEHSTISDNSAVHIGGGIHSGQECTLTIVDSVISDNFAGQGGGISSYGTLTIVDSVVQGNHAVPTGPGGGIGNQLGGTLTIEHSIVADNSARHGGGIQNSQGSTSNITHSTVSGNQAVVSGGGINSSGILNVAYSTVSGNQAGIGGGISIESNGNMNLDHGTVSGNHASYGGGINNNGIMNINHGTVSGNQATRGGGIEFGTSSQAALEATLLAGNASANGGNCYVQTTFADHGYNLSGDMSCNLSAATSFNGAEADLGPLKDNGGPTWTHLPGPDSVAIDAAGDCAAEHPIDQRGVSRPYGAACDIGAVEVAPDPSIFVNGFEP